MCKNLPSREREAIATETLGEEGEVSGNGDDRKETDNYGTLEGAHRTRVTADAEGSIDSIPEEAEQTQSEHGPKDQHHRLSRDGIFVNEQDRRTQRYSGHEDENEGPSDRSVHQVDQSV